MATIRTFNPNPRSSHEMRRALQMIRIQVPPSSYDQTTDPGKTDDITKGWKVGSDWINVASSNSEERIIWTCADNAEGAAVWNRMVFVPTTVAGGVAAGTTDNTLARWDGTTGAKLEGSGIVLNDNDSLGAVLVQTNEPTNPVKGSMWLKNG